MISLVLYSVRYALEAPIVSNAVPSIFYRTDSPRRAEKLAIASQASCASAELMLLATERPVRAIERLCRAQPSQRLHQRRGTAVHDPRQSTSGLADRSSGWCALQAFP